MTNMKKLTQSTNQNKELVFKKKVIANLQTPAKTNFLLTTLSSSIL